jgi:hypothetical protein
MFGDYRMFCDDCIADGDGEIDLATAVDVAIGTCVKL